MVTWNDRRDPNVEVECETANLSLRVVATIPLCALRNIPLGRVNASEIAVADMLVPPVILRAAGPKPTFYPRRPLKDNIRAS